jgi:hypothetical protein
MKATTCDLVEIGVRMKAARDGLGLGQGEFSEQYGLNVRTFRKNETGLNEAGICLAGVFIRAGINANWLLTGEGPMLLADLVDASESRRKGELITAFEDYWHSLEREVRREVAAEDFQDAYNAGQRPRILGIDAIRASDIIAAYQVDKPAMPPPAAIDEDLLALCIQGVRQNAGPNDSPAHQAKKVMEFYRRFMDMRAEKPAAA